MWELDHNEGWVPKYLCFRIVVLEKTLESLLDWKEIKSVILKGNQSWIFTGRTNTEASVFWPPDVKSQLIRKDPDIGKDWRQEEKGVTEDEMVGWPSTQWTWVWGNSRRQWRIGKPGILQSMGSQRVTKTLSDWTTLQQEVSDISLLLVGGALPLFTIRCRSRDEWRAQISVCPQEGSFQQQP